MFFSMYGLFLSIVLISLNVSKSKFTISKYFNLVYQNKILTEENRKLRLHIYNMDDKKVDDLEKINFDVTSGSVIKNSYSFTNNFITIDVGKKDSVEIDHGVISSKGVVGIIDKTGRYLLFETICN